MNGCNHFRHMRRALFIATLLLQSFCLTQVEASHMMGADMYYECAGNGRYRIITKIYRDCFGVSLDMPRGMQVHAGGCTGVGYTKTIDAVRTGIRDITPVCSSAELPCNPANEPGKRGIEEHTFESMVDIREEPWAGFIQSGCCVFTFSFADCCRNTTITTGAASAEFYTSCMIDFCRIGTACNNSPVLSNAPVGYVCCNQPFLFNNGAFERDGTDSLVFSLVPAMRTATKSVPYLAGFSAENPMTALCTNQMPGECTPEPELNPPLGFYINRHTGDLAFTPTNCTETGILVIQVDEYRKDPKTGHWVKVGYIRRDMQLMVTACAPNAPPEIQGNWSHVVCEGEKLCFDLDIKDKPAPLQTEKDTLLVRWNQTIPNASLEQYGAAPDIQTAQFCWQTEVGDARNRPYVFTVTASDNRCPRPLASTRSVQVRVRKQVEMDRIYDVSNCGMLLLSCKPKDIAAEDVQYDRMVRNLQGAILQHIRASSNITDTFYYSAAQTVIISQQLSSSNLCLGSFTDTVQLPSRRIPDFSIQADQPAGCEPHSSGFSMQQHSSIPDNLLHYTWEFSNGQTSNLTNPHISFRDWGTYHAQLTVHNSEAPDCIKTIPLPVPIRVWSKPLTHWHSFPGQIVSESEPQVQFFNSSLTADGSSLKYHWNFGTGRAEDTSNVREPDFHFSYISEPTIYRVQLTCTSEHQCIDSSAGYIQVEKDLRIFLPNAFTPNANGPEENNAYRVQGISLESGELSIFNRSGQKVFHTKDLSAGWDGRSRGRECPGGVYVYQLDVLSASGRSYRYTGTLHLLR
jgi:gliding motility-associated-like protein